MPLIERMKGGRAFGAGCNQKAAAIGFNQRHMLPGAEGDALAENEPARGPWRRP